MKKGKEAIIYIKKIIGTVLLLGAVIYTGYSCNKQEKSRIRTENLPQITNRAEMEDALNVPKELYAVLNAPVCGTPVDAPFDILADDCIYILYSGEIIKESVYYPEDTVHLPCLCKAVE